MTDSFLSPSIGTSKVAVILIGPPGIGKSTFVADNPRFVVLSSDAFIQRAADKAGVTYDEYLSFNPDVALERADKMFRRHMRWARRAGRSVIIDRTNLRSKARRKLINAFHSDGYHVKGIIFKNVSWATWALRLQSRIGKRLSNSVIGQMIMSYEEPTNDEQWDELYYL